MQIKYSPISEPVSYKIDGEIIYIKVRDEVRKVDFSNLDDGRLESLIDYVSNAEKVDGELTVTLRQPLDKEGNELPALVEFEVDEYEEVFFEWKTWEEVEQEENKPNQQERIEALESALLELILERDTID